MTIKNFLTILLLPFFLISCDNLGTTRIKSLIDLTPKLEIDSVKTHLFSSGKDDPFKDQKARSYTISKKPIIAEPSIAKGVMYSVDQKGYVTAFSLDNKKILWIKDVSGNELNRHYNSGGILFSDNKLYLTHGTRNLIVLESETGHEIIRKEFPDILKTKPVMVNDRVLLLQTVSNQLVAYDTKSSKFLWMHEGGIETISSKNHIAPVIHNGHVLVSYSSGEVLYLNAINGSPVWRYSLFNSEELGAPSFDPSVIVTKPIITGHFVYFATSKGRLVKLDLTNGLEIWARNAYDVQNIVLHDNNLIVTNNARQVAIVSTNDGHIHWVGNLISPKERGSKKPKAVTFLDPFVVKDGDRYILNVIASNGDFYKFTTDDAGVLPDHPVISHVDKKLKYYWISCCNGFMHLISSTKVKF